MNDPTRSQDHADRGRARRRRRLVGILVAITVVAGAALGAGALIERNTLAAERAQFRPPPDEFVEVAGRTWHLDCDGPRSDGPTIVLEAGLGESSATWVDVQASLSESNRVCSYDRLGYGWSGPAPDDRGPEQEATELRHLLAAAGEPGPYVVVAHSLGALIARHFAALDSRVSSLVLIDPTNATRLCDGSVLPIIVATMQGTASQFGLIRPFVAGQLEAESDGALPAGLLERSGYLYRAEALYTSAAELRAASGSAPAPVIDVPAVVILPRNAPAGAQVEGVGDDVAVMHSSTEHHYIHYVEPQLVVDAVESLLSTSHGAG